MPLFAIVAALLLSACSGMHSYKYKVGVSQCVGGKWREKVNDEMLSAQHLYGNEVKVSIKNANDDSRLQAKQIDSLVASGAGADRRHELIAGHRPTQGLRLGYERQEGHRL